MEKAHKKTKEDAKLKKELEEEEKSKKERGKDYFLHSRAQRYYKDKQLYV